MTHGMASGDDGVAGLESFRQEVRAFIREALPVELRARVERGYDLLTRDESVVEPAVYGRRRKAKRFGGLLDA